MNRLLASFLLVGLGCTVIPVLVAPASAQGAPRSMSECERLKNDLAYNQCLAMFGPAAKNVGGGGGEGSGGSASSSVATALAAIPPGSAEAMPMAEEPAQEAGRGQRGRRGRYTRHGRQSASFSVGASETRSYRRRRRH